MDGPLVNQDGTREWREGDMADELELSLDPNGDDIKLRWSKDDEPPSKPLRLDIALLRKRSRDVRDALTALNSYVCTNQKLEEEKDPGWQRYAGFLKTLRQKGEALRSTLLDGEDPRSPRPAIGGRTESKLLRR